MSWVRIHDGALSHPKIVGMVDVRRPFDLWVWGLSYAQLHLTDGVIPGDAVQRSAAKAAQELVRRGLWEQRDSGYLIHDHLDWNDSRELVQERRDAKEDEKIAHREKMKRWREAKKRKRDALSDESQSRHRSASDATGDGVVPLLTKPNQTIVQKDPTVSALSGVTDRHMSGTTDSEIARRAGEFFRGWCRLYTEHRLGAVYHGKPSLEYGTCCNLVHKFQDALLVDLAVVFLNSNHPFIENSNRSLAVFESRITWCHEQLLKAKAQQRRSA